MHDREQMFRTIWGFTNRHGIIQKTQRELAVELDIPYQKVCNLFTEFTKIGIMKKFGRTFQMKDPQSVDWEGFRDLRRNVLDIWQKD